MLRDLSFRYKIPLRGIGVIVLTALVVTLSLVFRAYEDLRHDVLANAERLGRVLAVGLVPEMEHDDVWRAYELIRAPARAHEIGADNPPAFVVVLDAERKVYVATAPERFPMLADARQLDGDFAAIAARIDREDGDVRLLVEPPDSPHFYVVLPVAAEGAVLGHLVIGYGRDIFLPRFREIVRRAGLITLAILAVLLPITWVWGARLAAPLIELARYMKQAGTRLPEPGSLRLAASRDEIGQLGDAFRRMLLELKEKQALERQIVSADRLAAIGRLSAGIAHEINNPLGGMLNAINTFRVHGSADPLAAKTLSLLERGLQQIRDTVAALLVEARSSQHRLCADDVADVRTLVMAELHRKRAELIWESGIAGELPLPATAVRQILLNLLLNAARAAEETGTVVCRIRLADGALVISVGNDGDEIPRELLPYLFEPFVSGHEQGHGLGLWVTYQIVQQLGGTIRVDSRPGETRFTVRLPIPGDDE